MQATSGLWTPAWALDSITVVAWAEIWSGLNGSWLTNLLIDGGSVTDDWTNANRRTLSNLALTDDTGLLTPRTSIDTLFPDGFEVRVYSGIAYAGGALAAAYAKGKSLTTILSGPYTAASASANGYEAALLGTFLAETVAMNERGSDYTLSISGSDRSARVQRAKFTQPYATNGTDTLDVVIQKILNAQVPGLAYSLVTTSYVPPVQAYNVGDDPWAAAQRLATDGGYKLDFNEAGVVRLYAIVNPLTQQSAASYVEGAGCTVTSLDRSLTNKDVPNWIIGIAQGAGIAAPIRADWQDLNAASPTYLYGNYPTTVQTIQTNGASTLAQVQAMVAAQGALTTGKLEQVSMTVVGQPAHEAGDVVTITRARAGLSANRFVVDRFQHALGTGAGLTGTARKVA